MTCTQADYYLVLGPDCFHPSQKLNAMGKYWVINQAHSFQIHETFARMIWDGKPLLDVT